MPLEQAGQHDADAVERDLRREDPQHPGPDRDRGRPVAADGTEQHRHDRLGEHRDEHRERYENDHHPRHQRRRRGTDPRPVPAGDRSSDQRHDQAREGAAGDDLEDDVGYQVRSQVGRGQFGDRDLAKHERPDETEQATRDRQDGNQRGRAGETPNAG
jgi:hypothetical protein